MKQAFLICTCWLFTLGAYSQLRYGNTITISQPVFEDLYLAGGNIIVNAPVHGDLVISC